MANKKRDRSQFRELLYASQVGINMVASTFAGLAIGYFLDRFLDTSPWCTIIFLLLGIISGFIQLFRTALKEKDRNDKDTL